MTDQELIRQAEEAGFAAAAVVPTGEIPFDAGFRPYCEENLCGKYGVNYSCPPDCDTPEEMARRITGKKRALVLQTIWEIDDYSDNEAIKAAKGAHNRTTIALAKQLRSQGLPGFIVGASGCALCNPCAITQRQPCKFPDLQYSCMSAYCIFVRKLTERCGMEYDCGQGLLAFFGMYVCD